MKIFIIIMLIFIALELSIIYDEIKKGGGKNDA